MSGLSGTTEAFSKSVNGNRSKSSPTAKPKRRAPFSLALGDEERAQLKAAAGDLPLGTYIKGRLFEDLPAVPRQSKRPMVDRAALAKILGMLGQSRLSNNMNQIARASNKGILPLTPELIKDLNAACDEIKAMRGLLIDALGARGGSQ
jgi:hypothetical protein